MSHRFVHSIKYLIRPIHRFLVVVGFFFTLIPVALAQRVPVQTGRGGMGRIDQQEGARRLDAFRQQRLQGDYVFEFQLEHKPRRARTVRYQGIMWGSWNEQGAVTRFKIFANEAGRAENQALVELLVQNGPEPRAWIRRDPDAAMELVAGEAMFKPILPELVYSVFDLQMPFIYWKNFIYEGPSLIGMSRVGQNFLMLPPQGSQSAAQGIHGVRVALDDTYNALWRVEMVDADDNVRSRFAVESFKKVQQQYIVKKITLAEYPSKDRTTFEVMDASVGLELDAALFQLPAESPQHPAPGQSTR